MQKDKQSQSFQFVSTLLILMVLLFQNLIAAQETSSDNLSFNVTKTTTNEELNNLCQEVKLRYNILLKFVNIVRDQNNEITGLDSFFQTAYHSGGGFNGSRNPKFHPFNVSYDENKKIIVYKFLDQNPLDDHSIYIDGKKSTAEELAKFKPNELIQLTTLRMPKGDSKFILKSEKSNRYITKASIVKDKDIYIDGKKSTLKKFYKIDTENIGKIDTKKDINSVWITTKEKQ